MQSKKYANIKGSDLANGTLAVFFFLANGSCAMNKKHAGNCYPSDWHRCPTLTAMQGFEEKKQNRIDST